MAQYLAHTVNAQLFGLGAGTVGWILTMVTIGVVQWRIWVVSDLSIISSGYAWVGLWKVCFYSHTDLASKYSSLYCQMMGVSDSFVPMEIVAARVLMLVALVLGLLANASTLYGLRNIFFGLGKHRPIRLAFTIGGVLHLLASVSSLVPLGLNMQAVFTNQNISFPENFYMPSAPLQQHVGPAICMGLSGAILTVATGVIFLFYRFPSRRIHPKGQASGTGGGHDNPAFQSEE
ncbi:claudin-34-like [Engraulis encrasicolus]|uniref:claudin-34-like n=1 Tax=Engraulis encrasicolus TaxID=184585 RepID=UPI002FCFDAB5